MYEVNRNYKSEAKKEAKRKQELEVRNIPFQEILQLISV